MMLHRRDKSNSVPSRMGRLYPEHRNMLERAAKMTWSVVGMVLRNLYFVTVSRAAGGKIVSGHNLFLTVRSVILGKHEEINYL